MPETKFTMQDAMKHAIASHQAGDLANAERLYRAILAANPDHVDALHLLGVVACEQGRYESGIGLIDKALAIVPRHADALCNRGNALNALNRPQEALESCDKALEINPHDANTHYTRGNALSALKRPKEALESYDRALEINPRDGSVLSNRGNTLRALNRPQEALESYDRALEIYPNDATTLCNRADALLELHRLEEAFKTHARALAINPDPNRHSNMIFALNFDSGANTVQHQNERARWYELHAKRFAPQVAQHSNEPDPNRRLRIGYVSSHFRSQASTYAFGGVIVCHDSSRFDIVCYSDTGTEDDVTAQLRACTDKWHVTTALSDDELASLIRADGIDILVDCVGHMAGHRLLVFARKPAPIQVTAWGEPTGTGVETIDYLFADPVLVPANERHLFAESVFDLPNFLGYWVPDTLPEPTALPAIDNGYVTFGSFGRLIKIQDPVLRKWAAILRALPGARLKLKWDQSSADSSQLKRIGTVFTEEGIGAERVTLLGRTNRAKHFTAYQAVDIALDPFPHGGGMTTLDALWMGVPVVTCTGRTVSSRLAASSLTALNLTDFVASDLESYVKVAVAKASDWESLAKVRASLRERLAKSAIGDPKRYARAVEAAYIKMWASWCADK